MVMTNLVLSQFPDSIMTITNLTEREIEIVEALSFGFSSDEISAKFFISVLTVNTHRSTAMLKMNARNSSHLIRLCFEHGIISSTTSLTLAS